MTEQQDHLIQFYELFSEMEKYHKSKYFLKVTMYEDMSGNIKPDSSNAAPIIDFCDLADGIRKIRGYIIQKQMGNIDSNREKLTFLDRFYQANILFQHVRGERIYFTMHGDGCGSVWYADTEEKHAFEFYDFIHGSELLLVFMERLLPGIIPE